MTLNIALLIKANAAQAKGEVTSLATVTKAFGTQTRNAGNDTRQAAAAMAAYEARIAAMEAELRQLIATQGKTKPAFDSGAQSVGNMVAQFNDIGVMLAAGQNPLQLAIQQGTQITQSFGNRGAAGAVQLLKQGFVSMLSPLNLGTIAILAGGAALVQWGISALTAGNEAAVAAEKVDRLAEAQKAAGEASRTSQINIDKLRFGVDEEYQVELLREQIALREQYNQKSAELNSYLATTTDSIDLQRIKTADLVAEIENTVAAYQNNEASLAQQADRAATLAVMEGVRAQRASELEDRQRRAADEAARLARIDMSRGIQAAAVSAADLARLLGISVGLAAQLGGAGRRYDAELARTGQSSGPDSVRSRLQFEGGRFTPRVTGAGLATPVVTAGGTGGGGGGGGGAARAERDAVAELIAKLREEQAVLAELDPVKAQMLRYREQLKGATAAERAEVEALIMVREREKAMDQLGEFGANSVVDLLKTIGREGETANDVFKKIIRNLADMGIQALIVGKGPLAQLFGISGNIFQGGGRGGGGGWLGNLVSGLFGGGGGTGTLGLPAFADGMIFGAGGGRDDKILARVSAGESIINARATARHRPLLERINAGLPRFANGVIGGGGALSSAAADGAQAFNFNINVTGARGNGEIIDMVHQGVAKGIEIFQREVLPTAVIRISRNPHERGRG